MKALRQFGIILFISFLGELLATARGPAFSCSRKRLRTGLNVFRFVYGHSENKSGKKAAGFLIEIMPVMFLPAAVGLLDAWPSLR